MAQMERQFSSSEDRPPEDPRVPYYEFQPLVETLVSWIARKYACHT